MSSSLEKQISTTSATFSPEEMGSTSLRNADVNKRPPDFNDGVLIISRRTTDSKSVIFDNSSTPALYISGNQQLFTGNRSTLIHASGDSNRIQTGVNKDTFILYNNKNTIESGAGGDGYHLLAGSGSNTLKLGNDFDTDTLYLYSPTGNTNGANQQSPKNLTPIKIASRSSISHLQTIYVFSITPDESFSHSE